MNNNLGTHQSGNESVDFEDLLDEAMASYSSKEPRHGFERRILNGVAAASLLPRRNRAIVWTWRVAAVSILTTAALLLGIWTRFHHQSSPPQLADRRSPALTKPALTKPALTTPVPSPPAKPEPMPVSQRLGGHHKAIPAITEQTDTTLRLNTQEQLLAQLGLRHPEQAQAIVTQADLAKPIALLPLETRPIQIDPLSTQPIVIAPIQMAIVQSARFADPANLQP